MRKTNKSLYYLFPLIKGWSALADYPLNTYARSRSPDSLIVEYGKLSQPHAGEKIFENDTSIFIRCDIDKKFLDDYRLIMDGEYSRIQDHTKSVIISRALSIKDSQRIEKVLYKSKKMRKELEDTLGVDNIDILTSEYESKMFNEEQFKLEQHGG